MELRPICIENTRVHFSQSAQGVVYKDEWTEVSQTC